MQSSIYRRKSIILMCFALCACQGFAQIMTPTSIDSIPMTDGKKLAADVYIPSGCTSCPTILIQTPYNKNLFRLGLPLGTAQNLNASPYNWVIVDWRGFYGSSGAAVPSPNRGKDGYDVIDWIVSQPWSDGKVGTWGPSALGVIQYQTAREKHPNHTCAVPVVAHPQTDYGSYFYGGVLEESRLNQLDALGYGLSPFVLANPYYNLIWQIAETNTWYPDSIEIPMLNVGGWYDHNIDKMMDWFKDVKAQAALSVRDEQWLLVGPWVHGGTGVASVGTSVQGELNYPNAEKMNDTLANRFFAHYLLGAANDWENTPAITYYETGKDSWNSSTASTIDITNEEEYFLASGGNLQPDIPMNSDSGSTTFICDPGDPTPTVGGPTLSPALDQGPYNQSPLKARSDVLVFSGHALSNDVSVSGRIKLKVFVSCNQPDADIAVRVVDGYPDGRDMLINDGAKRLRFIQGYEKTDESFLVSGQVYETEVIMPFTNYTWLSGHQIKIYLSGSSSTRWNVNLQNGGAMYTPGDTNVAELTFHFSDVHPSALVLPTDDPLSNGISGVSSTTEMTIFPNPASTWLQVISKDQFQSFQILNLDGKLKKEASLNHGRIDVSDLEKGFYIIRLTGQSGEFFRSFIKD